MARKLERQVPADSGADDLEILHPERVVVIGGRTVTVREYGFVEGLRLRPLMQGLLDGLHQLTADGQELTLEGVLGLVSAELEPVLELVTIAAGVERGWLDELNDADGQLLLLAWWGANGPFFVRQLQTRLLTELLARQHRARLVAGSAGVTSTPPSSATATIPTGSATTPSAS